MRSLLVVSTKVGGVPEVLPPHMIVFAKPDADDLVSAISQGIETILSNTVDLWKMHQEVKGMYSWSNVAERTEIVYTRCMNTPSQTVRERITKYSRCGLFAGKLFCLVMILHNFLYLFLEWLCPRENIDICPGTILF